MTEYNIKLCSTFLLDVFFIFVGQYKFACKNSEPKVKSFWEESKHRREKIDRHKSVKLFKMLCLPPIFGVFAFRRITYQSFNTYQSLNLFCNKLYRLVGSVWWSKGVILPYKLLIDLAEQFSINSFNRNRFCKSYF